MKFNELAVAVFVNCVFIIPSIAKQVFDTFDRDGVPMNPGGGSTVLEGDKNWNGVGHNAVVSFDGTDYLVFHGYDANDKGKSKLRIEKITWFDGWPLVSKKT